MGRIWRNRSACRFCEGGAQDAEEMKEIVSVGNLEKTSVRKLAAAFKVRLVD